MKRANDLLASISDIDNLRLAFWKARKGRNYAAPVENYRQNLEVNLLELSKQIKSGNIKVGRYRYFKVFDPKERQICASAFSEQVLHHALMNICHPYFERVQVFHSYACRKGKGTYAAINTAKKFTNSNSWYLKLDVRKFFESIHHDTLKAQVVRMFKEQRLQELFEQIIDSYEAHPGRGVPIGNLTSQYFANHYLAGLDHFIKEQVRIKAYVRYMDDFVLWHDNKKSLKNAHIAIRDFVSDSLYCHLKPEELNRTKRGLTFLGYRIYPYWIGLSQRSKRRFAKKMHILETKYQSGEWSEDKCQRHVLPLLAFTQHADTKKFRESVFLKIKGQSS